MENHGMSAAVSTNPGSSNSFSQSSPSPQPETSSNFIHIASIEVSRQTVPHMDTANDDVCNPVVNPAVAANVALMSPNHQMQRPMSEMMPGVPNPMLNMGNGTSSENSSYVQSYRLHPNFQVLINPLSNLQQPSQISGEPSSMLNSIGNSTIGSSQVMTDPVFMNTNSQPTGDADLAAMERQQQRAAVEQQQQQPLIERIIVQSNSSPPTAAMQKQELQKLLAKYSKSPLQQPQQLYAILQAKTELLAVTIRLRVVRRQQHLQQQQQRLRQQRRQQRRQQLLSQVMGG